MRRLLLSLLAPAVLLTGCDGAKEKAGREKDKAAAAASGVAYKGDGPNEQLGEAQDRADDAAKDARHAEASSLQQQARTVKAEADVDADRLEQQAKAIRMQAKERAAPLEQQAKSVRAQQ
jgi:hypothetical protein